MGLAIALTLALVLSVAGWVWWRVSLRPSVSHNFAKELDAGVRSDEARSAVSLIVRAVPLLGGAPVYTVPNRAARDLELTVDGSERPGEPGYEELVSWLRTSRVREGLALWRQAASERVLGVGFLDGNSPELLAAQAEANDYGEVDITAASPPDNPVLANVSWAGSSSVTLARRLLEGDARVAASEGDGERARADVAALFGLGRLGGQIPCFFAGHIARSTMRAAVVTGFECLGARPWEEAELRAWADVLEAGLGDLNAPALLRLRRAILLDAVQRFYTDDGLQGGVLTVRGAAALADGSVGDTTGFAPSLLDYARAFRASLGASDRATVTEHIEAEFAAAMSLRHVRLWEFESHPAVERLRDSKSPLLGADWLSGTDPLGVLVGRELLVMHVDALRLIVAAHRYELESGRWPADAADVVPRFLPTVPLDAYDGRPLRFGTAPDGSLRVWSVGPDRADNGGTPLDPDAWRVGWRGSMEPSRRLLDLGSAEGDLVFWPVSAQNPDPEIEEAP